MRRPAFAIIFIASSAFAQVGPDNGFFRPTPNNDPSLTNYLVPVPPQPQQPSPFQAPQPVQPAQVAVLPMPVTVAAPPQPTEEAVDKAIREAEEARAKAAAGQVVAPIVGAFTGQTNERDR